MTLTTKLKLLKQEWLKAPPSKKKVLEYRGKLLRFALECRKKRRKKRSKQVEKIFGK